MKKRIGLMTVMVLGSIFSQAQQKTTLPGGITIGLRAGVNFQNINGKNGNNEKMENDLLTGFNAGVNAEIPVGSDFYIQPGVLFSTKGAKFKDDFPGQPIEGKVKISYVEIPVNFIYKPVLGTGRLLLGFGPYVALGIEGQAEYSGGGSNGKEDIKFKNKVKLSDADNVFYLRPVDAGANLLVGYQFAGKFSFQLNAQLGLVKINPEYEGLSNDDASWKNTGFGFSIGYRF